MWRLSFAPWWRRSRPSCGYGRVRGGPFAGGRLISTSRAGGIASQLLAGGFDLRDTAARLGHSGGGATTLRHYANPVPEVDRRAAAYLAQLTAEYFSVISSKLTWP